MNTLGLTFLNTAVQASYLVLALVLVRLIFKKAPRKLLCALWALVGLRLIFPFSLSSVFSLLPSRTPVAASSDVGGVYVQSGLPAIDRAVNTVLQTAASPVAPTQAVAEQTAINWGSVLTVVWLCGVCLLSLYALVSYLRLRRQVREAVKTEDGVWLCDKISSPFILGVVRPRIYLPSDAAEGDRPLILAHERAHLKRRDQLWKPLGFLLLTLYWFNPVLWVAYVLLCRDIELACDERVLQEQGSEIKKAYAEALLRCSAPKHLVRACPVAFGETGVKGRIKSVLNYKKPAFWVIVLALVASAVVAVCFMTTPRDLRDTLPDGMDEAIHTAILQDNGDGKWFGECATEGHVVYGCEQSGDQWKVYLYHGYERYGFINGYFTDVAGHWMCAVLTMQETEDGYTCKKIDYPRDGSENAPSIKRLFPKQLESRALNPSQSDSDEVTRQCEAQAGAYLKTISRGRDVRIVPYNQLDLQLPNLTAEVSNKLSNELGRMEGLYELTLGTREQLEKGVRYVYRTAMLHDTNSLLFVKEVFGSDEVRELMLFSAETGDLLYHDGGREQPNELHCFNARVTDRPGKRTRLMMPTREDLFSNGVVVNTETFSGQSSMASEGEYVTVYFNYPVAESSPEQMPYVHAICYMGDVYEGIESINSQWTSPAAREGTTQAANVVPTGPGVDPATTTTTKQEPMTTQWTTTTPPTTTVPPTTAKKPEPTTTKATEPPSTSKAQEPATTRAYTPEEAAAIHTLGEEAVVRFPDLKNTTNSYLFKAYALMNCYPKFQKANVTGYEIKPDGDGYQDITLHTDKGDFVAKYDGKYGVCLSNNQEPGKDLGIEYYFHDITKPENVQLISLYRAYYFMMQEHVQFQGAFVKSFDELVEEDKITVTLHTDKGDCTAVLGPTGKFISTSVSP